MNGRLGSRSLSRIKYSYWHGVLLLEFTINHGTLRIVNTSSRSEFSEEMIEWWKYFLCKQDLMHLTISNTFKSSKTTLTFDHICSVWIQVLMTWGVVVIYYIKDLSKVCSNCLSKISLCGALIISVGPRLYRVQFTTQRADSTSAIIE